MATNMLKRAAAYFLVVLPALALVHPASAQVVPGCGMLENAYGPYDYNDPEARSRRLPIVEEFHFTPEVATLVHGNTASVIKDLDYTLRAFPNHARALESIKRLALAGGMFLEGRPAECYFKRAVAFRPEDPAVRIIYGNYLLDCTRLANRTARQKLQCAGYSDPEHMDPRVLRTAKSQYDAALRLSPASPDVNYDAALFYVDIGDLDTAKRLADVAYQAGYPLMGLKKKLEMAEAQERPRHQPQH